MGNIKMGIFLKKGYYYLFYKLYKFFQACPEVWMSDQKAILSMIALEIWFSFSVLGYYLVVANSKDTESLLESPWIYTILVAILVIKYFAFGRNNDWKKYVREFDKWPKRKNRIGGIIAWTSILMVMANLVLAIYLFYQTKVQQT